MLPEGEVQVYPIASFKVKIKSTYKTTTVEKAGFREVKGVQILFGQSSTCLDQNFPIDMHAHLIASK